MKPSLNNVSAVYAGVNAAWYAFKILTATPVEIEQAKGPFRPKEWDSQDPDQVAARTSISDGKITYFFDAVLRIEHVSPLRITKHPIQSGANISDHAFKLPDKLSLEIGMSDVMDTFTNGQFSELSSKSVSAFKTMKDLQSKRLPLTVTTRLGTYQNMLIEQIAAHDDSKTMHGLKAIVHLEQIITSQVPIIQVVSKRRQVTGRTDRGPVQTTPLDNSSILSRLEKTAKDKLQQAKTGQGY